MPSMVMLSSFDRDIGRSTCLDAAAHQGEQQQDQEARRYPGKRVDVGLASPELALGLGSENQRQGDDAEECEIAEGDEQSAGSGVDVDRSIPPLRLGTLRSLRRLSAQADIWRSGIAFATAPITGRQSLCARFNVRPREEFIMGRFAAAILLSGLLCLTGCDRSAAVPKKASVTTRLPPARSGAPAPGFTSIGTPARKLSSRR
jgi:hypothetical protein